MLATSGTSRSAAIASACPGREPSESCPNTGDRFESFDSLLRQDTVVLVALSGGGIRAAALALETLAKLENAYNAMMAQYGLRNAPPFSARIDVVSSVSGGSLYAYFMAAGYTSQGARDDPNFFHTLATNFRHRLDALGPSAGLDAFLGLGLVTSSGFGTMIADQLDDDSQRVHTGTLRLGNVPPAPLFLFNTTALESGRPFVFSQSILHAPSSDAGRITARLDLNPDTSRARPLNSGHTLEDIGSSPGAFPLAVAAAASAAFPFGVEPVPLRRYQFDGDGNAYATDQQIHVTDGGVYDNSGLTSVVDLVEYLASPEIHRSAVLTQVIVISINAETDSYDTALAAPTAAQQGSLQTIGNVLNLNTGCLLLPFRCGSIGIDAVGLIHFTNKRRSEMIAIDRLKRLTERTPTSLAVHYFPINLSQLSPADPNALGGHAGAQMFGRLAGLPTDLALSSTQERLVEQASDIIITSEQPGWRVGPDCETFGRRALVNRLDTALSFALLRIPFAPPENTDRQTPRAHWLDPLPDPDASGGRVGQWCRDPVVVTTRGVRLRLDQFRAGTFSPRAPCGTAGPTAAGLDGDAHVVAALHRAGSPIREDIGTEVGFEFRIPEMLAGDSFTVVHSLSPVGGPADAQSGSVRPDARVRRISHTFGSADSGQCMRVVQRRTCDCDDDDLLGSDAAREWRMDLRNGDTVIASRSVTLQLRVNECVQLGRCAERLNP